MSGGNRANYFREQARKRLERIVDRVHVEAPASPLDPSRNEEWLARGREEATRRGLTEQRLAERLDRFCSRCSRWFVMPEEWQHNVQYALHTLRPGLQAVDASGSLSARGELLAALLEEGAAVVREQWLEANAGPPKRGRPRTARDLARDVTLAAAVSRELRNGSRSLNSAQELVSEWLGLEDGTVDHACRRVRRHFALVEHGVLNAEALSARGMTERDARRLLLLECAVLWKAAEEALIADALENPPSPRGNPRKTNPFSRASAG